MIVEYDAEVITVVEPLEGVENGWRSVYMNLYGRNGFYPGFSYYVTLPMPEAHAKAFKRGTQLKITVEEVPQA